MSQPIRGTVKPRRPTRLATADLHWLWWLNVRSLIVRGRGFGTRLVRQGPSKVE
jgi:hypothetical protein